LLYCWVFKSPTGEYFIPVKTRKFIRSSFSINRTVIVIRRGLYIEAAPELSEFIPEEVIS
jgi:hypothetical protein